MNSLDDILADEHLNAIGYFRTIHHPTEGNIREISVPDGMVGIAANRRTPCPAG